MLQIRRKPRSDQPFQDKASTIEVEIIEPEPMLPRYLRYIDLLGFLFVFLLPIGVILAL